MINANDWDYLPPGVRRELYVNELLDEMIIERMKIKGYDIVDVRTMPNSNVVEKKDFIQAYLLGVSDGTILSNDERRKSLEFLAKTEGLLVNKSISGRFNLTLDKDTIKELLDFGASRHTLVHASMEEMDQARLISITPGAGKDDEIHKNEK